MEQCKICGRHRKQAVQLTPTFEFNVEPFEDDRELSHFLYRLTQDIINTKNYSDENINRICEKHVRNSHYPDSQRLREVVQDLKNKLNIVNRKEIQSTAESKRQDITQTAENEKTMALQDVRRMKDKNISTQSLINVPKLLLKDASSSISTITTYNFPSSEEPKVDPLQLLITSTSRKSEMSPASSSTLQTIFLKPDPRELSANQTVQPVNSSVDALTRMVAASRKPESGCKRCPLGKCTHRKVHETVSRKVRKNDGLNF
ncbi:uncharacterized protein LOC126567130 [Anopheles maculipalpis]|uniref:uncharacterized protein LOC126567130 n=1 Tax=Anopheles maculipalpis TaxID=1496333 RepID=UPI0021596580|nr:uncharacterized protein LOC126567130 [Anopheles maculipalpis]